MTKILVKRQREKIYKHAKKMLDSTLKMLIDVWQMDEESEEKLQEDFFSIKMHLDNIIEDVEDIADREEYIANELGKTVIPDIMRSVRSMNECCKDADRTLKEFGIQSQAASFEHIGRAAVDMVVDILNLTQNGMRSTVIVRTRPRYTNHIMRGDTDYGSTYR